MNDLGISLDANRRSTTTTDLVFDAVHQAIITFQLPPGTKVSEAEVAKQLDVSRQPVRDVFFRLSKLGFIAIRPQRATLVTKISEQSVLEAAFIRKAIELSCLAEAIKVGTDEDIHALRALIQQQEASVEANDLQGFHALDDKFHKAICATAGHAHAWPLIEEQKAHIDRVRFLSLPSGLPTAFEQHKRIMDAIEERNTPRASKLLEEHLARIKDILQQVRTQHPEYFESP